MTKPLVSIIIPVYNGERYIRQTIEDIRQQTFGDYEVLLVDNNSTDGTLEMMRDLTRDSKRMRVLTCRRPGASAARNAGITNAEGTYLYFMDADDRHSRELLSGLVEQMQQGDMAVCGYETVENGETLYTSPAEEQGRITNERMLERLFEVEHYQGFVWTKMFRADVIHENHIRFHDNISYNEDRLFVVEYLIHVKMVSMTAKPLYYYQVHEDSAMATNRNLYVSEKEITEIDAFARMVELLEEYPRAQAAARCDMAYSELRIFKRMMSPKEYLRYRHSRLRRYARRFRRLGYEPGNEIERIFCRKLVLYGYTGISYSGQDPIALEQACIKEMHTDH